MAARMKRREMTLVAAACAVIALLGFGAGLTTMKGCTEETVRDGRITVRIQGKRFYLEPALDDATRIKGLGGRTEIEPDGGMIFAFPFPHILQFIMRNCPVPIDVAYLDDTGRVVAIHAMQPEPPQREDESDLDYEARLPRYSSRFPATFAVEVAGGTLEKLGLQPGDVVQFNALELKNRAQ